MTGQSMHQNIAAKTDRKAEYPKSIRIQKQAAVQKADPKPNQEAERSSQNIQQMRRSQLERFAKYVRDYDPTNPHIALKILHTHKVVEIMDLLCQAEQLSAEQSYLHFLSALYHDIGRFEQVRRYHTFLDAQSIDHAALSAQILKEGDFLDELTPEQKASVIAAVKEHSRLFIDPALQGETLVMAKMLRDADKLDIFRVFATEDFEVSCNGSLKQAAKETISDPVYASILHHKSVRREDRRTSLDIWSTFLGFFYDLNFDKSFEIADQQGYFRLPFGMVAFENPQTRQRIQDMLEETERYIASKTGRLKGNA